MATNDLRRTDLRSNVLETPYWITSAEFGALDTGDTAILFEWSEAGKIYIVHHCIVEVTTLCAGGTPLIDIGFGSVTAPGLNVITPIDADDLIKQGDITATTAGVYGWATSDGYTAWAAGTVTAATTGANTIHGAATTCPVAYATIAAAMTSGVAKCHLLISEVPGT